MSSWLYSCTDLEMVFTYVHVCVFLCVNALLEYLCVGGHKLWERQYRRLITSEAPNEHPHHSEH